MAGSVGRGGQAVVQLLPSGNGEEMSERRANNDLHGITLQMIVMQLVAEYGWEELGRLIEIRCFTHAPSVSSSLKFLRRTPWARDRVEQLYLRGRRERGGDHENGHSGGVVVG